MCKSTRKIQEIYDIKIKELEETIKDLSIKLKIAKDINENLQRCITELQDEKLESNPLIYKVLIDKITSYDKKMQQDRQLMFSIFCILSAILILTNVIKG